MNELRLTCASFQRRNGVDLVDDARAAGAEVELRDGVALSLHLVGSSGV